MAFRHEEPDRVPRYEQTVCSRIASELMGRPMHTGGGRIRFEETAARYEGEEVWAEYARQLLADVGDLIRELDFDIARAPWRHSARPAQKLAERTFRYEDRENDLWSVSRYDEGSEVFDQIDSAVRQEGIPAIERTVRALEGATEKARPPRAEDYADLFEVARRAGGDRFVPSSDGMLMIPPDTPWLEACATRPDLVERYLDCQMEQALRTIPHLPGFGIHGLWAGGDFASNAGPIYSPAMFRRFLLPRLRKVTAAAHRAGLVYLFRTDGNIWPVAQELLVDSGVDGYGEIDIDAGMELPEIKRQFPHLTLWGGISCGSTLVFDRPEQIREKVREVMEECAPGGGLIFGSSNAVHDGVPTENFVAMQAAAREFGVYRH